MRNKQGSRPQAAAIKKKKPAPPQPWWKKLSALPKSVLIFGGAVALVILIIVFLYFGSPRKEAPPPTPPKPAALLPGVFPERPTEQPDRPQQKAMTPEEEDRPTVQSIRFSPSQPTRMDTLKAEVLTESPDPGRLTYAYVWKVNDRIVEGAEGSSLDLSALDLKKKDLITVSVTPRDGERAGFAVESPVIAVHSIPPTLDLKMPNQTRKASEPLEIQLVSLHPDSDRVTFSLEAPIVPGMSIDPNSGKITWIIPPGQKGTIRFGAAVEDTEKTNVTRIFDITVEKSSVAPAPNPPSTP